MEDYSSLKEFTNDIDYEFEVKLHRSFHGSVTQLVLISCIEYNLAERENFIPNYTKKNVFYVYIGSMIVKYGENITEHFLENVQTAIAEVEKNYRKLDLTPEEQEEILAIAVKLKGDLPKLKVFKSSLDIFPLEFDDYDAVFGKKGKK